jgi:transcriptional regulator with XRE-family HTH domain
MRDARDIEIDQHVGARLRALRIMRGVTQTQLAKAAGLTFQQVQKYERGVSRIGPAKMTLFGELLGVTPAYFFDGVPSAESAESIPADIRDFISGRDGISIMRAFQLLAPAKRTAIIRLVQAIVARGSVP